MKVKIPVTNSIIGKLNGTNVEEVHTVTNVGHLSRTKAVSYTHLTLPTICSV